MELKINVICEGLPTTNNTAADDGDAVFGEHLYLGIQRGEEVIAAVSPDSELITFEPVFRVAQRGDGTTNFVGAFAKGTPHERFFYLVWLRAAVGGEPVRYGRAKIHLSHLPWSVVSQAVAEGATLIVRLSMTDKRGQPRCGSIRVGDAQWQL
jgi:Family of unknown function (DUF5990)